MNRLSNGETEGERVGNVSGLMSKLNEIVERENEGKKLTNLWRLCLLSLMVEDEERLLKIKEMAKMMHVDESSGGELSDICDIYLGQMGNFKQENKIKEFTRLTPTKQVVETTVIDNVSGENKEEIGGLIGEMLKGQKMKNDALDEEDMNDDIKGVIVDEFKGDKVVFQSGNDGIGIDASENKQTDNEIEIIQQLEQGLISGVNE